MGGYGGLNGFPFQYGGGKSAEEATYDALRGAMGGDEARALGPKDGVEDAWMRAVAIGVAASESGPEAAAMQAFPNTASHHIEPWAERLGVDAQPTPQEQREANTVRYLELARADIPAITVDLAKLSPFLSVYQPHNAAMSVTQYGKAFTTGSGIGREFVEMSSAYPAYSDYYVLHVVWDHVASGLAAPPNELRSDLEAFLNARLPGWCDFTIQQHPETVFYLDGGPDGTSLLDITPLGPI